MLLSTGMQRSAMPRLGRPVGSVPRMYPAPSRGRISQSLAPSPCQAAGNGTAAQHAATNGNGNGSAAGALSHVQKIQQTAAYLRSKTTIEPEFVIVLGSGLGVIADDLTEALVLPYESIPNFHAPGVQGHAGRLVLGYLSGVPVMVMQGRFHYYEGYPMEEVIFPIRVAAALGVHSAVLTNAAGGINHNFHLGDLMLLTDHINFMSANPLRGPNPPELGGPRFLDLSDAYDRGFRDIVTKLADEQGVASSLQSGVYAAVSGPTYETPAETRMLRALGADAVGMSTVPEVIAARHAKLKVLGVSVITNLACGISHDGIAAAVSHSEVMENVLLGTEKLRALLRTGLPRMQATIQQQQQQQRGQQPAAVGAAAAGGSA